MSKFAKKVEARLTGDFMAVAGYVSLLAGAAPEPAMVGTYQIIQDTKTVVKKLMGRSCRHCR